MIIADRVCVGQELAAISATPSPDPKNWIFSPINNRIFNPHIRGGEHVAPEEWVKRGVDGLEAALSGSDC